MFVWNDITTTKHSNTDVDSEPEVKQLYLIDISLAQLLLLYICLIFIVEYIRVIRSDDDCY